MSVKGIMHDLKQVINNCHSNELTSQDREFIYRELQTNVQGLLEPICNKNNSFMKDVNNLEVSEDIGNKSIVKIKVGKEEYIFNLDKILKEGKDSLKKYKLDQLKGFLKKYSLNNSGKKNELVDRIIDFVKSTQIKFLDNFSDEDNDKILSSELEDATKKNIKYKEQLVSKIFNSIIKNCKKTKLGNNPNEWNNVFNGYKEEGDGIFCSIWVNDDKLRIIKFKVSNDEKIVFKDKKDNNTIYDKKNYDKIILEYYQIK